VAHCGKRVALAKSDLQHSSALVTSSVHPTDHFSSCQE